MVDFTFWKPFVLVGVILATWWVLFSWWLQGYPPPLGLLLSVTWSEAPEFSRPSLRIFSSGLSCLSLTGVLAWWTSSLLLNMCTMVALLLCQLRNPMKHANFHNWDAYIYEKIEYNSQLRNQYGPCRGLAVYCRSKIIKGSKFNRDLLILNYSYIKVTMSVCPLCRGYHVI